MLNLTKQSVGILAILLIMALTFAACGSGRTKSSTFPNINDADVPDILEMSVGTLGNTYYISDIKDNTDYTSLLSVNFEKTTEADYAELMKHYKSNFIGMDQDGSLLFDWGRLQVMRNNDTISINAFIK